MDWEKEKQIRKERWMKENAWKSQMLSQNIQSLNPEIGFYIEVNKLEISEDFFKKEYDKIVEAYNSVMKKLEKYYKDNK